jgi:hypothetical protein
VVVEQHTGLRQSGESVGADETRRASAQAGLPAGSDSL